MMLSDTRFNRNVIAALFDATMAAASFILSIYIRLGEDRLDMAETFIRQGTVLFTVICIGVFVYMRFYRGLWRYASLRDLVTIAQSVTLAILIFAVVLFAINRLENVPRSLFFINWMLLVFLLGGPRFLYRAVKDRTLKWELRLDETVKIPVLLIGANDNAEQFIRDMARDHGAPYEVVGIVDDDPSRKGRSIHGVMIFGAADILPTIVRKLTRKGKQPQKMILADDKASGSSVRSLPGVADELGIPLARLPKLSQFKAGVSEKPDIQPIAIEDLLGRPQNVLDRDAMRRLVEGKIVLVTGCGGTIGGELSRQIASYGPAKLVLVEMGEFNLYQIEREIRGTFPGLPLSALLCDVRNVAHIDAIFTQHRPQLVLHAAAIKHVPLSEQNIEEAVLTNVFGTRCIAQACAAHKVEAMVMISTDKAVNPTNVMGASKRLAESFCQALGQSQKDEGQTKFITVRFGNVLGSTGSVVPLFQEQISKGGPITVTHPDVTRYFMTVREAVELVLQAAALGRAMAGRNEVIFVLDMGQPVRIADLAMQMIRLTGLRPDEDIKIAYTGLRPGEKLYEELFHFSENAAKTDHASIFLASPRFVEMSGLHKSLDRLFSACCERNAAEALAVLKQLVPEFSHEPR
jgi:O-antigen biosynthesis protein WbqV